MYYLVHALLVGEYPWFIVIYIWSILVLEFLRENSNFHRSERDWSRWCTPPIMTLFATFHASPLKLICLFTCGLEVGACVCGCMHVWLHVCVCVCCMWLCFTYACVHDCMCVAHARLSVYVCAGALIWLMVVFVFCEGLLNSSRRWVILSFLWYVCFLVDFCLNLFGVWLMAGCEGGALIAETSPCRFFLLHLTEL